MLYFLISPLISFHFGVFNFVKLLFIENKIPPWTLAFLLSHFSGFKNMQRLYYQEGKYNYASQLLGGTVVMCSPQGDFITPRICIECLLIKGRASLFLRKRHQPQGEIDRSF